MALGCYFTYLWGPGMWDHCVSFRLNFLGGPVAPYNGAALASPSSVRSLKGLGAVCASGDVEAHERLLQGLFGVSYASYKLLAVCCMSSHVDRLAN